MPLTSIVFGYMMIALGAILYTASVYRNLFAPLIDEAVPPGNPWLRPLTALIPAAFGIALIVLGLLAQRDGRRRMHAMHAAALLGLLGLVLPLLRIVITLTRGLGPGWALPMAGNCVLALLSGAFLVLCIRSFRAARREQAASLHG